MAADQLMHLRANLGDRMGPCRDRECHPPPAVQGAPRRGAGPNPAVGHDPQFARKRHGFAQARYLEHDTQLFRPGRHIAASFLLQERPAIPQMGDSGDSGQRGATPESIRHEMGA
jgi:hypothetical protein